MNIDLIMKNSWQTRTLQCPIKAIKEDGGSIIFIENPSEELCLLSVKNHRGHNIKYINNPSEKICLISVKENGANIGYIKNPSDKVMLEALKQNYRSIEMFKKEWLKDIKNKELIKYLRYVEKINKIKENVHDEDLLENICEVYWNKKLSEAEKESKINLLILEQA